MALSRGIEMDHCKSVYIYGYMWMWMYTLVANERFMKR
jgi:hypothetical protein